MNLSFSTSRIALTRSSPLAFISIFSPERLTSPPTFLKSKRVAISREVWLIALSTSCHSTFETMSKLESAMVSWSP